MPHRTGPLCSTLAPVTQDRNTRQQHNFGFACRLPFRDLANDQLGDLGWVRSGGEKGVSFADSDPDTTSLHAHKRTGSLAQQTRTHYVLLHRRVCAKSLQSCLMLCDPMDSSLPGSSVRGISQARILEWVAISSFPSPRDLPNPGKISVQISLQDSPFNCFRYIFRIAGSYGNSVFNFWRSCQIAFHRGYTTLHSHQQCTRVPVSPYPCQH